MPVTSNYGFEYESPSSLPGVTLTGGPALASPILAVQVDSALATIEARIDNIDSDIVTIQSDITAVENSVTAVQTSITNLTNWSRRGTASISFTTLSAFTAVVNYGFTFPSVPTVMTNIDSGVGATSRWESRAISATTTNFTLFLYQSNAVTNTWTDIPVSWTALYRA